MEKTIKRKPIRVFKGSISGDKPATAGGTETPEVTVKKPIKIYRDSSNVDRASITQQVIEQPVAQTAVEGEGVKTKYEAFLQCVYDAVLIANLAGKIIEANARAEHNFACARNKLCGMNVIDLISGADGQLLEVLRRNTADNRYTLLEAVCLRDDKSRFYAEIVVNKFRADKTDALCFFIRDVTARKQVESEMKDASENRAEAESIKARRMTISTLFRELNKPLQVLSWMAESDKNKAYKEQIDRIVAVLEELWKEAPLKTEESEGAVPAYEMAAQNSEPDTTGMAVLLVVEEETQRKMMAAAISSALAEIAVETAAGGAEAVELFKAKQHDVIVMDMFTMGMPGEETFARIKEVCEQGAWDVPSFVFCTGFVPSDALQQIVGDQSAHCCLEKPFSMEDLVRIVKKRLSGDSLVLV